MPAHGTSAYGNLRRLFVLSTYLGLLIVFLLPTFSFAAETGVGDVPVSNVPLSQCAVSVTNFTPHVYDGALHSFDFEISDPAYVVLNARAGDSSYGFQYATRWMAEGSRRIHVDVSSVDLLSRDAPIEVLLVSAQSGTICTTTYREVVPRVLPPRPDSPISQSNNYPTTPVVPSPGDSNTGSATGELPGSNGQEGEGGDSNQSGEAMFVGALHSLGNLCVTGGSNRLWIVLIVLFALFTFVLMMQKTDLLGIKTLEWHSALLLLIFLGLIAFWYFSRACRAGSWVPIVAACITLCGLVGLFLYRKPAEDKVLFLENKRGE
ncbi:MAG: hypothetical protein RIQ56_869 [Candidatus Parcubacteria bacterium]